MAYFNFLTNEIKGSIGRAHFRDPCKYTNEAPSLKTNKKNWKGTKTDDSNCIMYWTVQKKTQNELQKKCWTAFTSLQRVAAAFYKNHWDYLGLSDKDRNPLNVVAEFFKSLVVTHNFDPYQIYNKIPQTTEIVISPPLLNSERNSIVCEYTNNMAVDASRQPTILFVCFQSNGVNHGAKREWKNGGKLSFPTKFQYGDILYIMAIVSELIDGKRQLTAAIISEADYRAIIGETWIPFYMSNGNWWYEYPETLCGSNVNCTFTNETLTFG